MVRWIGGSSWSAGYDPLFSRTGNATNAETDYTIRDAMGNGVSYLLMLAPRHAIREALSEAEEQ